MFGQPTNDTSFSGATLQPASKDEMANTAPADNTTSYVDAISAVAPTVAPAVDQTVPVVEPQVASPATKTPAPSMFDQTTATPSPFDSPVAEPTVEPAPAQVTQPVAPVSDDLINIKQQALQQLGPLVGQLDQDPEEKFRTTMMMIQASDNSDLIKEAYSAATQIQDEKVRAQALLDIVNEINYFTHAKENNA